jgi:serine/threonine-protein kinase
MPTEVQLAWGLARRFRIVWRLGAGGMGTVLLFEQNAVGNRPAALKVLNRKHLDDPEFPLRFQNDAASTGRVHHPNVVTVCGSGQADEGRPYIVTARLEDESLNTKYNLHEALPWRTSPPPECH